MLIKKEVFLFCSNLCMCKLNFLNMYYAILIYVLFCIFFWNGAMCKVNNRK